MIEIKLQEETQYDLILILLMKFGYKVIGYIMEASMLRGIMTLKEAKPEVISDDMDIYEPESVKQVTDEFITRFGIFQIGEISSIFNMYIILGLFVLLENNYIYNLSRWRLEIFANFLAFEFIMELFLTLMVPLTIKIIRSEFRKKNFQDIVLRKTSKHALGFLMTHLLGFFISLFLLEKYGFNLIADQG